MTPFLEDFIIYLMGLTFPFYIQKVRIFYK